MTVVELLVAEVLFDNSVSDWLVTFNDDGMVTIVFWLIEIDESVANVLLGLGVCVVFDGMNIV